ncbi:hypothetical protein M0802_015462 [Mischocyttarus mexicanus]|nr:hypothetical protein M0802_015462 [Mischocyttarus mexicanus]
MLRLDYVKTNPEKLEVCFVRNFKRLRHGFLSKSKEKILKGCVTVFSAKVKVKSKPSDRQEGKGSKKLLVQFTRASGFSQRKDNVKSKQSNRQECQRSKKLQVWFSQG